VKKRRILRSERGFTLVELGIVMAIIAILAAVAYPTYQGMRERAYIAEAKASLQEARVTIWATFVEHGEKWPGQFITGTSGPTVPAVPAPAASNGWSYTMTGVNDDGDFVVTATRGSTTVKMTLTSEGTATFETT